MYKEHLKIIKDLEKKISEQKLQLKIANESLALKNKQLDALHYVWCDGGCNSGVHRYCKDELAKETIELAIRNTNRLINYFNNKEFNKLYDSNKRNNEEIEYIKSSLNDVWFYYSIICPKKTYHKIIKFFSNLVEY